MINLHCSKRRKVALIKEEQFEQVLVQETSADDQSRAQVQEYNNLMSNREPQTKIDTRPDQEGEEKFEERRQKYLEQLQKVLIEFDTLSRTTDMLKSKQHLSLQACDRPATSFRNLPRSPSSLLASRQADLHGCRSILAKGLVQSNEVSRRRRLFALDCLALRRHWKLVLSSSSSTVTTGFVSGADKEAVAVTRIGKGDSLAVDCSYATAGDAYDENWFTKVNRHLPFIVQLSVGDKGAMLCDAHLKSHEKEVDASSGTASSMLSTLKFSLQFRDDIAQQWFQVASVTSYNTLRVNSSHADSCEPSGEARQTCARPNLLDLMDVEESDDRYVEEKHQFADSVDHLDAIHEHCSRVQHDQFCRRMFDILLAEALKPRDDGDFVVSDHRLRHFTLGSVQPALDSLTLSQAMQKGFLSSLQVLAASRSSISVALSPTLSLCISLEHQCMSTSNVDSDCSTNNNTSFLQRCLRQSIISLEGERLSRFEKSRHMTELSEFSAGDAFRNRFSSLRRNRNGASASAVPLLQHVQQELQKQLWKLRVKEMLKQDYMKGVRCSWAKRGFDKEVLVLEIAAAGELCGLEHVAGSDIARSLVLRLHPGFVEAEALSCTNAQAPLLRLNTDTLLERHVKKWVQPTRLR